MKNHTTLQALTPEEMVLVSGGIRAIAPSVPQAEDMYGNKLSHEDYMDFQLAVANGQASPHDFGSWDRFSK